MLRPNAAQRLLLHPHSAPAPQMLTVQVQKQALKCALLKGCRVPRVVPRLTALPIKHPGTCSSPPLLTVFHSLSPSHIEPLTVF